MAVKSLLTTTSEDASYGTSTWKETVATALAEADGTFATLDPAIIAGNTYTTRYIKGLNLVTPPEPTATITEIRVYVTANRSSSNDAVRFDRVRLVKGGTVQAVEAASDEALNNTFTEHEFTFTAANLATMTITTADVRATDFGVVVNFDLAVEDVGDPAGGSMPQVDLIRMEFDVNDPGYGPIGLTGGRFVLTDNDFRPFKGRK